MKAALLATIYEVESRVAKARLVAQEFADDTLRAELFAGVPDLSSVKCLFSSVCTGQHAQPSQEMVLMPLDVRSVFSSRITSTQRAHQDSARGPARQDHFRKIRERSGLTESQMMPRICFNECVDIAVATHVDDDFFAVG